LGAEIIIFAPVDTEGKTLYSLGDVEIGRQFLLTHKNTVSTQTAPLSRNEADNERIIMSSTGTPFDITGFRTPEKFKNHDADASRIDSLSTCPDVEETCRIFSGSDLS